jgi:hypothetical protein
MKRSVFFLSFFLLPLSLFPKDKTTDLPLSPGGVPGQIIDASGGQKIYFESGIVVEWSGNDLTLTDGAKKVLKINLTESPEKATAREMLGEEVMERDLGGSSKKKAPLAYKNPKIRNIKLPTGGDPLKTSGMQPSKVSEEKTPEGGTVTTTEYPDGSKNVVYVASNLKEENSFDKKGTLIYRNLEGEEKGLKYKKTQWEEGSSSREYSKTQGTLSMVYDAQKGIFIFSILNGNREVVKEVNCVKGECEL